ncbi:unnamed protein product [Clonostachys solani]|uniref:4-amino-5-hydroxymethyl-2-methylpyrimidine phosphate synthase n=1 Tax=Clonostachys solani TaxID=160281 RepID=A0A9N9Z8Z2_9HYPO|nr:unnamed protein product [Clonostachys solani]
MERFHVTATGHSLNYLPEYIAQRHGFFKEQGLNVSTTVPAPWDLVLGDLADGRAEAALGGIWVPSMYRGRGTSYTAFAQVSNRAPLALVKRGSSEGFKVSDIMGRTVLLKSGNGASVGLFFKMMLRDNGISPDSVNFVQDLDGIMLGNLFQGGMGDYFFVDNVTARVMAARNPNVSVAMEMVIDGGEIPWSVYYRETETTTPGVLDAQTRFCMALGKAIDWILQNDADSFRDELAQIFPKIPVDILVALTNLYRRKDMWTTPTVSRKGFERWQKGIADGLLVEKPFRYEAIVNNGPASEAQSRKP